MAEILGGSLTKMSCGIPVVFLWYYIIPQKIPQGWRGTTHIHVVLQRFSLWYPCGTENTIGNTTEKNYTTKIPYSSAVVFLWYSVIPQKILQGWKSPHRFLWYCRGVACGTHVVKKYHRKYHTEKNPIQKCPVVFHAVPVFTTQITTGIYVTTKYVWYFTMDLCANIS